MAHDWQQLQTQVNRQLNVLLPSAMELLQVNHGRGPQPPGENSVSATRIHWLQAGGRRPAAHQPELMLLSWDLFHLCPSYEPRQVAEVSHQPTQQRV